LRAASRRKLKALEKIMKAPKTSEEMRRMLVERIPDVP
jgi:hypothetical protein